MRVLIVKTSALGDIVHALPVLDFLHQAAPGIEIDWVVEERFADILSGNPLINQLFTVDTKKWRKNLFSPATWKAVLNLKAQFAERHYSIVFDLQGNIKSGLIAKYSGCGRRYGFDENAVRESANLRFTTNHVPLRKQDHHVTDRSLRVVSVPFGRDYSGLPLETEIATSPGDDQSAELFLATLLDGLVFLFHPGTTWKTKLWNENGWIELGKELTELFPDATIIISWGGKDEKRVAETIASGIGRHTKLLPQLSIKEFTAIIKKVDLMFGGDTGPIHVAAAVGTPTVSFYRATDGRRNGPRGEIHRIVQSPLPCTKCLKRECDKDGSCRESITVREMLTAALTLLDSTNDNVG
jgi:heptosyltransferase-1